MGNEEIGIKKIARCLRKLDIKDDTILLIKLDSPLAGGENMDALVRALKVLGLKRVIVVAVEDISAIKPVSVADMNAAGWYRVDTLRGLLNKSAARPVVEANEEST